MSGPALKRPKRIRDRVPPPSARRACALAFAPKAHRVCDDYRRRAKLADPSEKASGSRKARRTATAQRSPDGQNEPADRIPASKRPGWCIHGTVLDCSDEDWDFSFDLIRQIDPARSAPFLPGMMEAGPRRDRQHFVPPPACQGRAQPLRLRCDERDVEALTPRSPPTFIPGRRATCICPAPSKRPMLQGQRRTAPADVRCSSRGQPMGRARTAEEIARSPSTRQRRRSAFTTGVAHMNGGADSLENNLSLRSRAGAALEGRARAPHGSRRARALLTMRNSE